MSPSLWVSDRLPVAKGGNPEIGSSLPAWVRGSVAMRRPWIVTALSLLVLAAFWEVRTMVRVQAVVVSPAEVVQMAATGTIATATVHRAHILLQRRSEQDGSIGARVRAWVGLPADGQLLVMRSESAAEMDRVRAQLVAHGVRILGE